MLPALQPVPVGAADPTNQVGMLGLVVKREFPLTVEVIGTDSPKAYIPTVASVELNNVAPATPSSIVVLALDVALRIVISRGTLMPEGVQVDVPQI